MTAAIDSSRLYGGLTSLRDVNPRSPLFQEEWVGEDASQWSRLTIKADGELTEL